MSRRTLFAEHEIAGAVARVAREIAVRTPPVDLAVPVLAGAFVFAADLLRALAHEGRDLPVEFIRLSRYGNAQNGAAEILVRMGAGEVVRNRNVLLIDGVLDHGHTLEKARALLFEAGAKSVAIAVAVDKARANARVKPDHAAFTGVDAFVVGYGMDDAGMGRGLPYIAESAQNSFSSRS